MRNSSATDVLHTTGRFDELGGAGASTVGSLGGECFRATCHNYGADWYHRALGFEVTDERAAFTGLRHPDTGLRLVLLEQPDLARGDHLQVLDHVAFAVASRDELAVWVEALAAGGFPSEIEDGRFGQSVSLHDPDGTEVELFVPNAG